MKISKRELILNSIIEAYLSQNSPIGSSELGNRIGVNIPASTVRVYFKQLSDEGAITKLHISGGRIPTYHTMYKYWQDRIGFDKIFIKNQLALDSLSDEYQIYCMIFTSDQEELKEVLNYDDKFIVLVFDDDEIVMKFDARVFKFLQNLIGKQLVELERISMQIGLSELRAKISALKHSKIVYVANEVVAFEIFKDERFKLLFDPSFTAKLSKNLIFTPFFEPGFMGVRREVNYKGKEATMICAGSVYEDFEKYFNIMKEVA